MSSRSVYPTNRLNGWGSSGPVPHITKKQNTYINLTKVITQPQHQHNGPINKTPITGHIDILQIRNGLLHILDYKPEAEKQQPIEQLTLYAMALSRKLNLELYHFKCPTCEARSETRSPCHWFDQNSYHEFFPLHAVYKKIT